MASLDAHLGVFDRWQRANSQARWAGIAAFFAAPVAILRAEKVWPADLADDEFRRVFQKYTTEYGMLPWPLRRLRANQRWIETPDDKYLPAGLYEDDVRRLYERFGLLVAGWYWLGVRNRAYEVMRRHRYTWQPGDRFVQVGAAHPGDAHARVPTTPGRWECFVYRRTEAGDQLVAFEVDEIRLWSGGRRFTQRKYGWKLRAVIGRQALGLPPTAEDSSAGYLQAMSWRPTQKAVRP